MSGPVCEWLPPGAADSLALQAVVEQAVSAWADAWCGANPWRFEWRTWKVGLDDLRPHRAGRDFAIATGGDAVLARHALKLPLDWMPDEGPEQTLVASFATRMIAGLAEALGRCLGAAPGDGDDAAMTLALVDVEGTPALAIGVSHDQLVAVAKRLMPAPARPPAPFAATLAAACAAQTATLTAHLGTARLTLADLAGLAIGDVVVLDRTDDQPLDLHVGDRPALRGRFAESTAAIAIAIVN